MTNRLLELEQELARSRAPSARARSVRIPGRTRAFAAPVDYRVPGVVPPIAQPTSMTCWATVTAIMFGWRHQRSDPIENVLREIGPGWLARFRGNQGLRAADKEPFLTAAGMTWLEPQSLSVEGWERLLRDNGPLWVTTDEQAGPGFAIHARVMAGIHGDGTPAGTSVDIVDPAGGREYSERLSTFLRKFEEEAASGGDLRIQIVHFRPGTSQARSLGAGTMRERPGARRSAALAMPAPGAHRAWEGLISFRPDTRVQSALKDRFALPGMRDAMHHLEDANGDINLDFYAVRVSTLPEIGGRRATPEELLEHIRVNLNSFVDSRLAAFSPYEEPVDGTPWRGGTPGAVMHIDMRMGGENWNPDDGAVVLAEKAPDHWTFSTLWTPGDQSHPVSGNRRWGFFREDNGGYVFYSRGADRVTLVVDLAVDTVIFSAADWLWKSFQEKVYQFVNAHSGAATVLPSVSERWDWPAIRGQYHHPTTGWI
jgi:hypothetical protein